MRGNDGPVPPGDYTFEVTASNEDGVWSKTGDKFAFRLLPKFYQTMWFYVLAAVAVVCTGVLLNGAHVRQLRLRAAGLEAIVDERTRELAAANVELRRLSSIDALTGLANRRRFDERLDEEWLRARRASSKLSIVMIDIDEFKGFNDGYGHLRGDDCLRRVAHALQKCVVRSGDLIARYGGEEFVLLLPDTDEAGAFAVATRLRDDVHALGLPHEFSGTAGVVTISSGIGTMIPKGDSPPEELVACADRWLYEAKRRAEIASSCRRSSVPLVQGARRLGRSSEQLPHASINDYAEIVEDAADSGKLGRVRRTWFDRLATPSSLLHPSGPPAPPR